MVTIIVLTVLGAIGSRSLTKVNRKENLTPKQEMVEFGKALLGSFTFFATAGAHILITIKK
jgi:hypothetical protein